MGHLCFRYVFALLPFVMIGQEVATNSTSPRPPVRAVRASADATITGKPDHAQIRIGVVTQAATAQAAAQQNADQTSHVLSVLRTAVEKGGDLKTTDYSISPQYQYGNNVPPKLTGYRVSNTVLVELNQIESVGTAIDASVKAGANDVTGISFSLKNDTNLRLEAISEATSKARANAEAIAKALGAEVAGVLEAEATGSATAPPIRPMPMMRAAAMESAPTPVEAGTIEVRANVTVTLSLR